MRSGASNGAPMVPASRSRTEVDVAISQEEAGACEGFSSHQQPVLVFAGSNHRTNNASQTGHCNSGFQLKESGKNFTEFRILNSFYYQMHVC